MLQSSGNSIVDRSFKLELFSLIGPGDELSQGEVICVSVDLALDEWVKNHSKQYFGRIVVSATGKVLQILTPNI